MYRRLFSLVCVAFLGGAVFVSAQEADYREELRFVDALRKRKDNRLALELLEKMAKGAPADLARELPLELAKTRLEAASEEPDSGRRLKLYKDADVELRQFIERSPGHPRVAEANLDIARVLNFRGKTELSRALISDDKKARQSGALQARATLEEANKRLQAAVVALEAQLVKLTGDTKEKQRERARLEEEVRNTKLEIGLNVYDQNRTHLAGDEEGGSAKVVMAAKALRPLVANTPIESPVHWKAMAWLGRCEEVIDNSTKARITYATILSAPRNEATAEARRLAGYFTLLLNKESPTDADKKNPKGLNQLMIERAEGWRKDFARYRHSPEGLGVSFLLAQAYIERSMAKKVKGAVVNKTKDLTSARDLLRELEIGENDFTEEARQLKLRVMSEQGTFGKDIALLNNFDECFVRSEFEIQRLRIESEKATSAEELKKVRDTRIPKIIEALTRGLGLPDAKLPLVLPQVRRARLTLCYWLLVSGKHKPAIEVGEAFVLKDPSAPQAPLAASYALDGYSIHLAKRKAEAAMPDEMAEDRAAMFRLARLMEERWPREDAGNMARQTIGLVLLQESNYAEAIKKFSAVTLDYSNLVLARSELAKACLLAEQGSFEPITGDRPADKDKNFAGDYRRRAMAAWESMPESALGSDPYTNSLYVDAKIRLANEWYAFERFADMEKVAQGLLPRVEKLRFGVQDEADKKMRVGLQGRLVGVALYAKFGQARNAFIESDNDQVITLLSPLIAELKKAADTPEKTFLKKNLGLAMPMLTLALKANLQKGNINETDAVLEAIDGVQNEGEAKNSGQVLKTLVPLIRQQVDDLRAKRDKVALEKAIKGYTDILDKRTGKQKELSAEFLETLAACYSSMGQHGKAAVELGKINLPKKAAAGSPDEKLLRRVQLNRVRELRMSKDKKNLDTAIELMAKIIGTPKEPGWGKRDLTALTEHGLLLEAQEKYSEAFAVWMPLVKALNGKTNQPRIKDVYLECYFHMVFCFHKHGRTMTSQGKRDEYLRNAAIKIAELAKGWEDFGSEASKKRFDELFAEEPALHQQYMDELRKKGR